jgi:hypothetical protein
MTTLLYLFNDFDAALSLRDELLRIGFDPECVCHKALESEARPAEGNFAVGSGRSQSGEPRAGITIGRDARYAANFVRVGTPSTQLLTIDCRTQDEEAEAANAAQRFGGHRYGAAP